jgi:hypothetical protein
LIQFDKRAKSIKELVGKKGRKKKGGRGRKGKRRGRKKRKGTVWETLSCDQYHALGHRPRASICIAKITQHYLSELFELH